MADKDEHSVCPLVVRPHAKVHAMTADARHWAARLRAERKARRWDVPEMARRLAQAAGAVRSNLPDHETLVAYVRRWEARRAGITERYRLLYSIAFGIDEHDLFGSPSDLDRLEELSEAAITAEALDLAAWLETTNIGSGTIGYLAASTKRLNVDYARRPPLEVLAEAFKLQRRTVALIRGGHQRLSQTQTLVKIAAELFALIGLLSGDVGRYPAADAYGYTAWTCAEEADSDTARALVLSAQSKTARWENKFGEAAELARRGFELCPPSPERILLAAAEATALQSRGDIEGAWQAMGRAKAAREEIGEHEDVSTAWTCPQARQATYALQVGLGAEDPAAVLREVEAADGAWAAGDPWVYGTWAQARIGAALAHVMRGDPEGAADELVPVFDLETQYRVVTIVGRIGEVGRRLASRRFTGSSHAADLRERIRAFQSGSLEHTAIEAPEAP
jgi:hypothetical protein